MANDSRNTRNKSFLYSSHFFLYNCFELEFVSTPIVVPGALVPLMLQDLSHNKPRRIPTDATLPLHQPRAHSLFQADHYRPTGTNISSSICHATFYLFVFTLDDSCLDRNSHDPSLHLHIGPGGLCGRYVRPILPRHTPFAMTSFETLHSVKHHQENSITNARQRLS